MSGNIIRTGGKKNTPTVNTDQFLEVEVTADGYLRLPAQFSQEYFSYDKCIGTITNGLFILWPATNYTDAAILMKQRNVAGDRSTLIREIWGDDYPVGTFTAKWESSRRRLVLNPGTASEDNDE